MRQPPPPTAMPRKIEKDVALDRALTLFWDHGYRGTSMALLTAALGVEKPSLYASFGSKQGLYLAALRGYRETLLDRVDAALGAEGSPRAAIEKLVRRLMARGTRRSRQGCLATNAVLERAGHEPSARAELRRTFEALAERFAAALARAQAAGEVRGDVPAATLAQLLLNAVEGARIVERIPVAATTMDAVADLVLQGLDGPAVPSRPSPRQRPGS